MKRGIGFDQWHQTSIHTPLKWSEQLWIQRFSGLCRWILFKSNNTIRRNIPGFNDTVQIQSRTGANSKMNQNQIQSKWTSSFCPAYFPYFPAKMFQRQIDDNSIRNKSIPSSPVKSERNANSFGFVGPSFSTRKSLGQVSINYDTGALITFTDTIRADAQYSPFVLISPTRQNNAAILLSHWGGWMEAGKSNWTECMNKTLNEWNQTKPTEKNKTNRHQEQSKRNGDVLRSRYVVTGFFFLGCQR